MDPFFRPVILMDLPSVPNERKSGFPLEIVFCAFHAAYKIEPEIWGCWMRILKAVHESILWLKFKPADDAMKNLKAEAVQLGVSSKRIILAEDLPDREGPFVENGCGRSLSRLSLIQRTCKFNGCSAC